MPPKARGGQARGGRGGGGRGRGRVGKGQPNWICGGCSNNNYGWRDVCNKCPHTRDGNPVAGEKKGLVLKMPVVTTKAQQQQQQHQQQQKITKVADGGGAEDARAAIAR